MDLIHVINAVKHDLFVIYISLNLNSFGHTFFFLTRMDLLDILVTLLFQQRMPFLCKSIEFYYIFIKTNKLCTTKFRQSSKKQNLDNFIND